MELGANHIQPPRGYVTPAPSSAPIETLTAEEREDMLMADAPGWKALRIIDAQAVRIAELEAQQTTTLSVTAMTPAAQELQAQIEQACLATFAAGLCPPAERAVLDAMAEVDFRFLKYLSEAHDFEPATKEIVRREIALQVSGEKP